MGVPALMLVEGVGGGDGFVDGFVPPPAAMTPAAAAPPAMAKITSSLDEMPPAVSPRTLVC